MPSASSLKTHGGEDVIAPQKTWGRLPWIYDPSCRKRATTNNSPMRDADGANKIEDGPEDDIWWMHIA
jgi:hypothetical protein